MAARKPGRRNAPEITIAILGTQGLFVYVLGWHYWPAFIASLVIALVVGIAGAAVRDLFFRGVPEQLEEPLHEYLTSGWRIARIHPLACDREEPHVHLVNRSNGLTMVLTGQGVAVSA